MKALILAVLLATPLPAAAQGWQVYSYPDDAVEVQLPAAPTVTKGAYGTAAGASVPATTYALKQADAAYSLTVASLGQGDKDTVIGDAVKALSAGGEVKIDVEARVDREYGRSLSLFGKDGSRSLISVFFVRGKLYELVGKALPPRPELASSKTLQFQQSLDFLDVVGAAGRP
jgi:hypothetical protein